MSGLTEFYKRAGVTGVSAFMESYPSEVELSLLVIDLQTSCVVKVEKGEMPNIPGLLTNWIVGETVIDTRPFPELRAAIDALDGEKPVPRIERDKFGNDYLVFDDGAGVYNLTLGLKGYDALTAINGGKPLPVYEGKKGEWTPLTCMDWTEAQQRAGEIGYSINIRSYEDTIVPFKAWRYTLKGEQK